VHGYGSIALAFWKAFWQVTPQWMAFGRKYGLGNERDIPFEI
jgi:hypothetical protein